MRKKLATSLLLCCIISLMAFKSPDLFKDITTAIKIGNATALSGMFSERIELRVEDKEDIYSKAQAGIMVKQFFSAHPPQDFEIIHTGSSEETAHYAIGLLQTQDELSFRVYIFIKKTDKQTQIQELKFEQTD